MKSYKGFKVSEYQKMLINRDQEIADLKEKMTDCKGTLTSVRVWLRDSIDGIVSSKHEQNALDCIKSLIEKVQKELTIN